MEEGRQVRRQSINIVLGTPTTGRSEGIDDWASVIASLHRASGNKPHASIEELGEQAPLSRLGPCAGPYSLVLETNARSWSSE